jgi:hypothetical protein
MGQDQSKSAIPEIPQTAGAGADAAANAAKTTADEARSGGLGAPGRGRVHPNRRTAGGQPMEPVFVYPSTFQGNITANMKPSGPPPFDTSKDALFGGAVGTVATEQVQTNQQQQQQQQKPAPKAVDKHSCLACTLFGRSGGQTNAAQKSSPTVAPEPKAAGAGAGAGASSTSSGQAAVDWARQYLAESAARNTVPSSAPPSWQAAQSAGGMGLNAEQKARLQQEVMVQQHRDATRQYRETQMKQLQHAQQQQAAIQAQINHAQMNIGNVGGSRDEATDPYRFQNAPQQLRQFQQSREFQQSQAGPQDRFQHAYPARSQIPQSKSRALDRFQQGGFEYAYEMPAATVGGASRSKSYAHSRLRKSRSHSRSRSRSRSHHATKKRSHHASKKPSHRSKMSKKPSHRSKMSKHHSRPRYVRKSRSRSINVNSFLRSIKSIAPRRSRLSRTTRSSRGSKKRMGGASLTQNALLRGLGALPEVPAPPTTKAARLAGWHRSRRSKSRSRRDRSRSRYGHHHHHHGYGGYRTFSWSSRPSLLGGAHKKASRTSKSAGKSMIGKSITMPKNL